MLLVLPVVMLAGWFAWTAFTGRSTAVPLDPVASHQDGSKHAVGANTEPSGGGRSAKPVVVHVAGAVARPSVVTLPEGSRVFEAIAAAGGAAADADANQLNLAGTVRDGDKLHVPRRGEVAQVGGAGNANSGAQSMAGGASGGTPTAAVPGRAAGGTVNINQATAEELGSLPRVGPVLAGKIVTFRTEHGPFSSVDELDAVDGIGPKMLEALRPFVTV